jgi:hypothetical protein
MNVIRTDIDDFKLSIKELGLRVIEFGTIQENQKELIKEILEKVRISKRKKKKK